MQRLNSCIYIFLFKNMYIHEFMYTRICIYMNSCIYMNTHTYAALEFMYIHILVQEYVYT